MTHWFALATTICLTVLANILLKYSGAISSSISEAPTEVTAIRSAVTPLKVAALGTYATAFLVYGYALRSIAVSVAYPIMASGSVIVLGVVGFALFDESFPPSKIIGTAMVLVGVVLLARS